MKKLEGMSALITGAARGIGKSIAETFAANGANLALCNKGSEASVWLAGKLSKDYKIKTFGCKLDVSDRENCRTIIDRVVKEFGRIDILVNNAGITKDNLAVRMSEDEWDSVMDVNLKGAFFMTQFAARYMMKQRKGCIINMTSVAGQTGNIGQVNYASSKGGLIGLTKSMARELAPRNIRVNAVSPGFVETQMTHNIPEPVREKVLAMIPLARTGKPEDVAKSVLFLASPDADYITGHILSVNGGLYI